MQVRYDQLENVLPLQIPPPGLRINLDIELG